MNFFVKLDLLTIPRLKAYRKSLYKKIGPYEMCWCGNPCCDFEIDHNRNSSRYQFLKLELERVNKELGKRQKIELEKEDKKNEAHVYTHAEWKRHHHPPYREIKKRLRK